MDKLIERLRELDNIVNNALFLASDWQQEADDLLTEMVDWEEGEEAPSAEQLESAGHVLENELSEARDLIKALLGELQTEADMEAIRRRVNN